MGEATYIGYKHMWASPHWHNPDLQELQKIEDRGQARISTCPHCGQVIRDSAPRADIALPEGDGFALGPSHFCGMDVGMEPSFGVHMPKGMPNNTASND